MSRAINLDRSLVAIFDIEGWSKRNPAAQAHQVEAFVDALERRLGTLIELAPDAFSTGDGAIVSIGRNCHVDGPSASAFLDFVLTFTEDTIASGLSIRSVVNYSEGDRIVPIDGSSVLKEGFVQVGDTINLATRMMTFCEPGEVLLSDSVVRFLRVHDLDQEYRLHRNHPFVTKHEEVLKTYTFKPTPATSHLYSPEAPEHNFKQYSNFPPIKSETFRFFRENGLEFELHKVVESAYNSMRHVNDTLSFTSWSEVLNVLTSLRYDEDDSVYVISRNDRKSNFWTQRRARRYIDYLSRNARHADGYINQVRVVIYDDDDAGPMGPESSEMLAALKELHRTNTLFALPATRLFRYDHVEGLRFGFTLSEKHQYGIISTPAPEDVNVAGSLAEQIGRLLERYEEYDQHDGPMKAYITADQEYVQTLHHEIQEILSDPFISLIK